MRAHASIRPRVVIAALGVLIALMAIPPASADTDAHLHRVLTEALQVRVPSAHRSTAQSPTARRAVPARTASRPILDPAPWPWRSVSIDTDGLPTDGVPDDAQIWPWADARYDYQTGAAKWAIYLYGDPSSAVAYIGVLGHLNDGVCEKQIIQITIGTDSGWASAKDDFATTHTSSAAQLHAGGTAGLSWVAMNAATDLRSGALDCAYALTAPSDSGDSYYQTTGWVRLHIHPRPDPKLKITAPAGTLMKPGHRKKIRIRVTNTSAVPAPRTTVRVRGGHPSHKLLKLKTIPPHATRTARVKVKLRRARTTVRLLARATGATAAKRRVLLAAPITLPKGDSLTGRYFWHTQSSTYEGWDNSGLAFVNRRWAYAGFPRKGLPKCGHQSTVTGDSGCVQYTWNKHTHKLRVGRMRGSFRPGHALSVGNSGWTEVKIPKKGTRLKVSLHHLDFYGFYPNITTWTDYLSMTKNGRFILSTAMIGSIGAGSPTVWSSTSSKVKGHYTVGARGLLTLRYADGHVRRATIGLGLRKGRANPQKAGLLIGATNYYVG